jgi:hypothetical protein
MQWHTEYGKCCEVFAGRDWGEPNENLGVMKRNR